MSTDQRVPEMTAVPRGPGGLMSRPRLAAILCVAVLAGLGWIYLGLMVAGALGHGDAAALGPGMGVLERLIPSGGLGRAIVDAICRPMLAGDHAMGSAGTWQPLDFALVLVMWCAMALAMMLPTAGPMIVTYAEIADTAQRKGEPVVSPHVLAAGYLSVWIGFAVLASVLQWALVRLALLDPALKPVSGLFSGAVFLLAGAYQFSALKHACVTLCQRPFPFFFANWTTEPAKVFRLGARQGLYCLGCCWAMMLVMFAVGVMNVVWMAALGAIMASEKIATTTRISRTLGVAFIAIGLVLVVSSVAAHGPVHAG
jgi:predicted metal-binding membrane protein